MSRALSRATTPATPRSNGDSTNSPPRATAWCRGTAARLTRVYEDMRASCGGTVHEKVVVGMSDETFRRCALQARFGNIRQVVVDQDGASPLRLYVFGSGSPSRVYTIDGVVTAVQP